MKDECFINTFENLSRDFYGLSIEFMKKVPFSSPKFFENVFFPAESCPILVLIWFSSRFLEGSMYFVDICYFIGIKLR